MNNRIRELRKKRNITMKQLGAELGLAESTISQYETGKRSVDNETLLKLGDIFGVSVGYILGSERESMQSEKKAPVLTEKDERDIAKEVERIMENLESSGDLMFDGVPMSAEAKRSMSAAMQLGLEAARLKNKETYTPKKYRKE